MSKKVRALLITAGTVIFFSWGFRLYVLYIHWDDDPFILPHFLLALLSFGIGAFFLWMAKKGPKAVRRDYTILLCAALFTVVWWGYRWVKVQLHPEGDPNPRAHLHLASLFLVLGGLLIWTGWKGRRRLE